MGGGSRMEQKSRKPTTTNRNRKNRFQDFGSSGDRSDKVMASLLRSHGNAKRLRVPGGLLHPALNFPYEKSYWYRKDLILSDFVRAAWPVAAGLVSVTLIYAFCRLMLNRSCWRCRTPLLPNRRRKLLLGFLPLTPCDRCGSWRGYLLR